MTGRFATLGIGLHAALLLARGRPEGVSLLAADRPEEFTAAARSFWAVALCLPAFICLHLIDWAQSGVPVRPAHGFAMDLLGYLIGWLSFVLLSRSLAAALGRIWRWPRFVTIWNWCNVVQYFMLVAAALPSLLGLPYFLAETTWLVAIGWALWLEWYATRLALDVSGLAAAGVVVLDMTIGLFLVSITGSIS
jgi:hypothetical protein